MYDSLFSCLSIASKINNPFRFEKLLPQHLIKSAFAWSDSEPRGRGSNVIRKCVPIASYPSAPASVREKCLLGRARRHGYRDWETAIWRPLLSLSRHWRFIRLVSQFEATLQPLYEWMKRVTLLYAVKVQFIFSFLCSNIEMDRRVCWRGGHAAKKRGQESNPGRCDRN